MPQDIEIRCIAKKWVERYHDDALGQARQRLDELKEAGERDAYQLWRQIYDETASLVKQKQTRY